MLNVIPLWIKIQRYEKPNRGLKAKPKSRFVVNTHSVLSLSRIVPCGVGQGVRACRMLRPKLTLHVGEHALTNICHRHRLALLVCIPRRVHVSSFERHFHSIEIPFPIGSSPSLARLAACVYRGFETNLRTRRWTWWNYRELAWRTSNRTIVTLTMTPCMIYRCQAKLQSCTNRRMHVVPNDFLLFNRTYICSIFTCAIQIVYLLSFNFECIITIPLTEELFNEITFHESWSEN